MAQIKNRKNALGRGIKALINPKSKVDRSLEEKKADQGKNMEFYRSLVRQYVKTGDRDMLIEQLLNEIR